MAMFVGALVGSTFIEPLTTGLLAQIPNVPGSAITNPFAVTQQGGGANNMVMNAGSSAIGGGGGGLFSSIGGGVQNIASNAKGILNSPGFLLICAGGLALILVLK